MRKLTTRESSKYASKLDQIAGEIEFNWQEHGIPNERIARDLAFRIDRVSDEIEKRSERDFVAEEIESDPDEDYMPEAYDEEGTIDQDADEDYMRDFINAEESDDMYTRVESPTKDLNPYSDGFERQPSQESAPSDQYGRYARRYRSRTARGRRFARRLRD